MIEQEPVLNTFLLRGRSLVCPCRIFSGCEHQILHDASAKVINDKYGNDNNKDNAHDVVLDV